MENSCYLETATDSDIKLPILGHNAGHYLPPYKRGKLEYFYWNPVIRFTV